MGAESVGAKRNPATWNIQESERPLKLENLQALRGVAVLLVLLFHLVTIEEKYGGGILLPRSLTAGMSGVDLFFLISGFIMATVTRGRFREAAYVPRFLWARFTRIYPLYWFYTLLVLLAFVVRPAWVNASQGGRLDLVSSFLLLPGDGLPVLMVGWTLVHEMYFYLVLALLLRVVPEKKFTAALLGWAAVVILASLRFGPDGGKYVLLLASPLTLEFIAGCLIALMVRKHRGYLDGISAYWAWVGVALAAASGGAGYLAFRHMTGLLMPEAWTRFFIFGIPAAILTFSIMLLERPGFPRPSFRMPRWLVRTGDASYSIYLSHILVLGALGRLWSAFHSPSRWDNALVLPALLAAAVGAGMLGNRWLEKPLQRWTRSLSKVAE